MSIKEQNSDSTAILTFRWRFHREGFLLCNGSWDLDRQHFDIFFLRQCKGEIEVDLCFFGWSLDVKDMSYNQVLDHLYFTKHMQIINYGSFSSHSLPKSCAPFLDRFGLSSGVGFEL